MTDPTTPRPAMWLVTAPGAHSDEPTAATDDGALLELALWLADVAAEAAVSTTASAAEPSLREEADEPPAGGRAG